MRDVNAQWINHSYDGTYRFASDVQAVIDNIYDYARDLEGLTLDLGVLAFVPHWQKDTALHKFIRYIVDLDLAEDNDGSIRIPFGNDSFHRKWTIPIEASFVNYGIQEEIEFEIPDIKPIVIRQNRIESYRDAPELLDACSEYFNEVRWTAAYEQLLYKIADEVFYVMFTNRATLQKLHRYLANTVQSDCDLGYIREEHPEFVKHFTGAGKIRRTTVPKWARRAVFYRDRGLCTKCKKDLSGVLNIFNTENFDHIVPLARGGLNDVTNLQLLCESCNSSKSAQHQLASTSYQRWF